jgi:TatD DNase family protein
MINPMIDTHAHPLLCKRSVDEFFSNAKAAGLTHVVGVATSIQNGLDTLALSQRFPQLVPTIGIHPCEALEADKLDSLEDLVQKHPFKAIGEIGLDFYRDGAPKARQYEVFGHQLEVARRYKLPVIIHSRLADTEMLEWLPKYDDVRKVIHCFSSKVEFAKQAINDTTFFSFTGMVTYSNKAYLKDVIHFLPLDKMMIETDCPYLTPTKYAGEENQSAYVGEIAKMIAEVKGCSLEAVVEKTSETAKRFFKI